MTWAMSSRVRSSITKIAVAGVLIAIPTTGVSVPAYATPGFRGTSDPLAPYGVHPAQPPAVPSTDVPQPPRPPLVFAPAPVDASDSWAYGQGDGGAGGGGGGG